MLKAGKLLQPLCLALLLTVIPCPGMTSATVTSSSLKTSLPSAGSAAGLNRAALRERLLLKYREMAVISDDRYRITQTAIRDNRAHQTPLHTSELLFNKCMHDRRYGEAVTIASLAVFDSDTPVERARFTLLQAEACLLRQDNLCAIQPLLQQASEELNGVSTHDDAWQQAKAMLDDLKTGLLPD